MKFVKRITALFLAMVMVMAMGITAFAAETTGNDNDGWTISVKEGDTHTYSVYQILTGNNANGVLSNVAYGQNIAESKKGNSAQSVADAIAALDDGDGALSGQALANAIAAYVNFESNAYGSVTASSPKTQVPSGYYLIKDEGDKNQGATTASYSTYIVKVVSDVEIESKAKTPTFEKKIADVNDSTGTLPTDITTNTWQDSADYDIGDHIPFKLEGTVADNYASYSKYSFIFHDVEEEGLTFDGASSVKVYVDGTNITTGYTVKTSGFAAGDTCTFEIVFDNLKSINGSDGNPLVKAGSKITVYYTSTLNEKATVGDEGEVNKAKLEYSNNPNSGQEGETGETPWDNVIVFTYKVVVNKVDSQSQPLAKAAFELQKKNASGTYETVAYKNVKLGQDGKPELDSNGKMQLVSDAETSFSWSGLDDGDYKLIEVITPDGYNTIDPITFTVTAEHTLTWDGTNRNDVLTSISGTKATGEITFSATKSEGSLSTSVVNKKGSELPSTGGMGTTVLYVAGIAMIVVAGVVVIARKRNA